jgi:hypothetical protein
VLALGATDDGKAISNFCTSALDSAVCRKFAGAPATVTDFMLAFEFNLTVSVRPGPFPTLVALSVAVTPMSRCSGWTLTFRSNELTCQITVVVVWPRIAAGAWSNNKRSVQTIIVFILGK